MRQSEGQSDQLPIHPDDGIQPLLSLPLNLPDRLGRLRRGRAVILPRLTAGCDLPAEGEDFRIVILSEPPDGPVTPGAGVVVSAPAGRLTATARQTREPAATYSAATPSLNLPPADLKLLSQGRLFASIPLEHTPEQIFDHGKANLDLLAHDIMIAEEMRQRLGPIAIALAAPEPARPAGPERLEELRDLIQAMSGSDLQDTASEAQEALDRLSDLAFSDGPEQLLTCLSGTYPNDRSLMEDIYILRSLRQSPDEAKQLLADRRFLQRAAVPDREQDLALDRSLVMEQLTPAALVTEPEHIAAARATLELFRHKYAARYTRHHTGAWAEIAREHARLLEARPRAEALRRINTLSELGPPAGIGALAACDDLAARAAGCPLIAGVEDIVLTDAICPACSLSLDQPLPSHRVDDVLRQIDSSLQKQMGRLSSSAVQQVLRRSNDHQAEHFLKVVQASQISSLCDVIDDELIGYLRRFFIESRIRVALEPVLDQLQKGESPDLEEARDAMREVAQHLQRAFEATQRALPAAEPEAEVIQPEARKPRTRRTRKA